LYGETDELPDGLHVFDFAIEPELANNAMNEIVNLYKTQVHNRDPRILMIDPSKSPTNTILFYSRDKKQPTFLDVMKILYYHTPKLAEYIMIYCRVIMELLRIDKSQLERSQISLVHYDRLAGLNPHIDSIHQFDDTIGPIATIAIGKGEKMFDMLPTLLPDRLPIRIYSQPNQITIMDGMSRVAWSHALPWRYDIEQFTVAIKFPELPNPVRHEEFVYQCVTTQVPYYL
jgi:alkylated DNA repair dioxygenase AlkB